MMKLWSGSRKEAQLPSFRPKVEVAANSQNAG
ncbi:hypothetical protein M2387_004343 [Klebsiella sp. BIGb0407]|nr:hypothetical protein [Klebsiella sp. BIGb0407]